jgi:DNA polymerase
MVKHVKWEARGKRRIHAKPSWSEQTACRPWLEAELAVIELVAAVL